MTAWLITGGAGFIGSNFLRLACQRDVDTIVVLDALTYAGDINNIVDIIDGRRIRFTKGNICDTDLVSELFSNFKFDCVIHFAQKVTLTDLYLDLNHSSRQIYRVHMF